MERPDPSRPTCSEVTKQLLKIRNAADKLHSLAKPDPVRPVPSDFQVRDAADKLLVYLRIDDLLDVSSPRDARVCELLLDVEPLIGAADLEELAAKIDRLDEVMSVTAELRRRAAAAVADALDLGTLTQLKGHWGDLRLNNWVVGIVRVYRDLMGAKGIVAAQARQGQARSLTAFLEAAAGPLNISQTRVEWRRRVKTVMDNQSADYISD